MTLKKQLVKLKENWLLVLAFVILLVFVAGNSSSIGTKSFAEPFFCARYGI